MVQGSTLRQKWRTRGSRRRGRGWGSGGASGSPKPFRAPAAAPRHRTVRQKEKKNPVSGDELKHARQRRLERLKTEQRVGGPYGEDLAGGGFALNEAALID